MNQNHNERVWSNALPLQAGQGQLGLPLSGEMDIPRSPGIAHSLPYPSCEPGGQEMLELAPALLTVTRTLRMLAWPYVPALRNVKHRSRIRVLTNAAWTSLDRSPEYTCVISEDRVLRRGTASPI
jgi:hypothetical protein